MVGFPSLAVSRFPALNAMADMGLGLLAIQRSRVERLPNINHEVLIPSLFVIQFHDNHYVFLVGGGLLSSDMNLANLQSSRRHVLTSFDGCSGTVR